MSTTFGINKLGLNIELVDDDMPFDSEGNYDYIEDDYIEVAFRGNGSGMRWTNDLAPFLPDDLKVYPLDNTAQGIYTIGDIKKEIQSQQK